MPIQKLGAYEPVLQPLPKLRREGYGGVKGFDLPLDLLDQDGALLAVISLVVPRRAGEVWVSHPGTGFWEFDDQARTA